MLLTIGIQKSDLTFEKLNRVSKPIEQALKCVYRRKKPVRRKKRALRLLATNTK